LAYDFNQTDKKVLSAFQGEFKSLVERVGGIGVLVNNVGMSNDDPQYLHLIDQGLIDSMLNVNNGGTMMMSRLCLPFMMKQRKGAVICVSSASCTHPTPLLSCYSATKGFGNQLTRSMFYEYKEFGIDCISITPYYFVSNMFKRRRETRMAPFPER
jgi:17beta-estradiol 17-dehydrogenase / very-long-chain 3-oxoacyl-CoA reductase